MQTTVRKRRLNIEETKEEMVKYIFDNFDFTTCRRVMNFLNWEWHGRGVPTLDMLRESAKHHIECAIAGCLDRNNNKSHHSPFFCASGGLKATATRDKYGNLDFVELEFVLTDWSCDSGIVDDLNKRNQDIYS
jgi:hypothetical protein